MSWDNSHIPTIRYEIVDEMGAIDTMAHALTKAGLGSVVPQLKSMRHKTMLYAQANLRVASNKTVIKAQQLINQRQGHSKSGYIPTGNLIRNTKDHELAGGLVHEIYSEATNKGYNYSQAFEFGLLDRNYPAQHPFTDAGKSMLSEVDLQMARALQKGFN